jgi:hypothetical protein
MYYENLPFLPSGGLKNIPNPEKFKLREPMLKNNEETGIIGEQPQPDKKQVSDKIYEEVKVI